MNLFAQVLAIAQGFSPTIAVVINVLIIGNKKGCLDGGVYTMQISGSTRKRADMFAPEENFQTVQFDSGKVHVSMPEADTEHVSPIKTGSSEETVVESKIQLKEHLKKSLQTISNCEKELTTIVAKINRERSYISGLIDRL